MTEVTQPGDGRGEDTRQLILRAASQHFAVMPYSQVNLDDVLASVDVTKGALYNHFRSKFALATAVVDWHRELSRVIVAQRIDMGLSGLETLIDVAYVVASSDMSRHLTRASLNLLESVGRFNGLQVAVLSDWVGGLADITSRALSEGDIRSDVAPVYVGRLLTSMYLGIRQMSDLDAPGPFIDDFEAVILLALPGFANHDRIPYLTGYIKRRSALAVKNAAPLRADKL